MIPKICNRMFIITIFCFFYIFAKVECVTVNSLREHHPIYGLSSLIEDKLVNSSICFKELSEFRHAVDDGKVWGLRVLDASGRPPAGFLYGNNLWIGSHSQCIDNMNRKKFEIRNDKVNHTETPFDFPPYELGFSDIMLRHNSTVQWHVRMPLDWVVQIGLCVPKSCTQQELFNLSQQYFSNLPLEFQKQYQVDLTVYKVRMLREDPFWLLKLPKTIIFVLITFPILLLTVFGTIYDVREHNREKNLIRGHNNGITNGKDVIINGVPPVQLVNTSNETLNHLKPRSVLMEILICFSFYSNVKLWMNTRLAADSLPVLHGLRFMAMGWVILVHTSFFQADFASNPPEAFRLTENFFAQIFSNSTYCVDTFLFLSGFLLAYIFFKSTNPHEAMKKHPNYFRKINQFVFMHINRFLRLTPTYGILILLCNIVYTFYSKKSSLYFKEEPEVVCDKYWWRNILYINNLYPRSEMCLSWSWYLSLDMQLFTIATFLLILSTMFFKIAAFLTVLLLLIQFSVTAYKSYSIGYIPTLDDQLAQLDAIYDFPWNRIGPYLVGVITAYILRIKLKNKLILKERTRLICWTVFPLLNLWILFTLYTRQISVEFSAFYMAASRILWGIGIAWFMVATSTGNARLLEKFMSYQAWIPLSRLTYCAYLINPLVVTMIGLGSEAPIVMTIPEMAISAGGTIFLTFTISFVVSILFESPFILLTKLIFKNMGNQPKKSISQEEIKEGIQNGVKQLTTSINNIA